MRYGFEWTPALVLFGMVIILPLAPAFAMIGLLVLAVAAVAALLALAGAVVATPYLVVRTVRRRLAERHEATPGPVPIATALAEPS
jgi:membrane associated rhomboid family serine protease